MLREAGRVAGEPSPQAVMLSYANITKRRVPCFRYIVTFRSEFIKTELYISYFNLALTVLL